MHHRHNGGARRDARSQIAGIDDARLANRKDGQRPAAPLERSRCVEDRLVLDGADDDLAAPGGFECLGCAPQGEVIGLGPAAGEHDLGRRRANQGCNLFTRRVDPSLGHLPKAMDARCVAGQVAHCCRHGVHDLRSGCRCRVVVQVDVHGQSHMVASPLTLSNKTTRQRFNASHILFGPGSPPARHPARRDWHPDYTSKTPTGGGRHVETG